MRTTHRNTTAGMDEFRDELGNLIGGVTRTPVAGLMVDPFTHAMTHVGWAHDWGGDYAEGEYVPVCVGVNDDREVLVAEIERRAWEVRN